MLRSRIPMKNVTSRFIGENQYKFHIYAWNSNESKLFVKKGSTLQSSCRKMGSLGCKWADLGKKAGSGTWADWGSNYCSGNKSAQGGKWVGWGKWGLGSGSS